MGSNILDWLTSVDEKLRKTNNFLKQIRDSVDEMKSQQPVDQTEEFKEAYVYAFDTDVPASTQRENPVRTIRNIKDDVEILRLIIGWPDGANDLVGVKFQESGGGEVMLPKNPEDEYTSNDGVTIKYTVNKKVDAGTDLEAVFINNDTVNSHFINVQLELREL